MYLKPNQLKDATALLGSKPKEKLVRNLLLHLSPIMDPRDVAACRDLPHVNGPAIMCVVGRKAIYVLRDDHIATLEEGKLVLIHPKAVKKERK
jgi:hypothetical protein